MAPHILSISAWSRLSRKFAHDEEKLYANKRNILFSKVTFIGAFLTVLHSLEDFFKGALLVGAMDLVIALFILVAFFINESGRHLAAKVFLLSFLNIFFFLYAQLVPRELGIYFSFFPWVAFAALVFESDEHFCRWFFILLSIAFLITLFLTDFGFLNSLRVEVEVTNFDVITNLITNVVITVALILLVVNMHEDAEQRYQRLTTEVQQKNAELQRTNEELDRFVYSVSHDIKAPVNSIKGLTHLAQRDCTDSKSLDYFSKIENQTDRLGTFLIELFEYARNQRTSLRPERVDLNELVEEIIDNLRYIEGASRIEFKRHIRIDELVFIDRVRLMVILNNLISNAIKYHNYELEKPWVKIIINRVADTIQVMVADNGLGIKNEHKDKIFDMFFRASDRPIGSGLGLFIVKETVEKMDGKIMLSSNPGEGACFRIDLPLVA